MSFVVASWNINSVRLRTKLISDFLSQHQVDVLCLQEIKCEDAHFPADFFQQLGFDNQLFSGQKSYNGVAILSKTPISPLVSDFSHPAARYISAKIGAISLHNFYVPAGGDIPDANLNDKFADKLTFLSQMHRLAIKKTKNTVWVGDFNIAPYEHDVWSHKQLINVVSHTPIEVENLELIREAGSFIDSARHFVPYNEKSYSWWSYRGLEWQKSNRGRRLDHIWVSDDLRNNLLQYQAFVTARGWERPSDHVPIMVQLKYPD
jgi:exodeoxyribonuclease III